jgi:hypothetical protein
MRREEDHLLKVNREIAEGMLRLVQHERRLGELERDGYDTGNATVLLAMFKDRLQQMLDHRNQILVSLGKRTPGGERDLSYRRGKTAGSRGL